MRVERKKLSSFNSIGVTTSTSPTPRLIQLIPSLSFRLLHLIEVINNHPCPLLREVVTRMDAMTVLLGIVAEKLSHVFVAQQLILFGKEGMDVVQ